MKSLQTVSNQVLVESLHLLISDERKLLTQILEHLAEVHRRRAYLEMGYSSLFTFCVKELNYTESQAQRRVLALRAIEAMPEIGGKLESGKLSLATVSLAQSHLMAREKVEGNPVSLPECAQIFSAIEEKSKREVEVYLANQTAENPKLAKHLLSQKESVRPLGSIEGEQQFELRFSVSKSLLDKLRRIQDLTSHTGKTRKFAEVIEYMNEIVLEKVDPERVNQRIESRRIQRIEVRAKKRVEGKTPNSESRKLLSTLSGDSSEVVLHGEVASDLEKTFPGKCSSDSLNVVSGDFLAESLGEFSKLLKPKPAGPQKIGLRKHVANRLKREVFREDGGRCSYVDPSSGKCCGETRYLEIDHRTPVAVGGINVDTNLRIRCRGHNLFEAVQVFGAEKMNRYLRQKFES